MASGGMSRTSRKEETRTPFSSTTGRPPPRPRPLETCGPSAASSSSTELTPSARISAGSSVISGTASPTTEPGRVPVAVTTSSRTS